MAACASRNISDIFKNQAAILKVLAGGKMAPVNADKDLSEDLQSVVEGEGRGHALTFKYMSGFAADIIIILPSYYRPQN